MVIHESNVEMQVYINACKWENIYSLNTTGHCTYTALLEKAKYEAHRILNDSCYGY